jgi:hypothetical protein
MLEGWAESLDHLEELLEKEKTSWQRIAAI